MTSNQTNSLNIFKKKIEDAVSLVPNMHADDKLQAIIFWNLLSEKLQDIVNHSAADINNALELQRENENIIDVFDSAAAQNEKELNDNLKSLISEQNTDDLSKSKNDLIENQLLFDNRDDGLIENSSMHNLDDNPLTNCSITDSLVRDLPDDLGNTNQFTSNLPDHLSDDISNNLQNNLQNSLNLPNNMNNHLETQPQQNQTNQNFIDNTHNELILEDISNFARNLELDHQEIMSNNDTQLKIDSTSTTVQKDLFNFDEFQRENVIRITNSANESVKQQIQTTNCDFNNINNRNNISQSIAANSNDSGFLSCNSNNCVESNNVNLYINQMNRLDTQPDAQFHNQPCSSQLIDYLDQNKTQNISSNNNLDLANHCSSEVVRPSQSIESKSNQVNGNKKKNKKETKKYSCEKCDNCFSTKSNLIAHQRKHTGEKPFRCDLCSSSFSTNGNLKRHIKAHSGEKPYSCDECQSRFTEKKSLTVHKRRHSGERPFQCPLCLKRFSQTGVLQTHMTLHSDERKFSCLICSKKFRQKSQLRLHQLRHEGVKKWNCVSCNSKFLTKGDLERHSRIHTGARPFKCEFELCLKAFTRQQSLNEHKNRFHFCVKPYNCNECDKKFVELSSFYKHIKIHKKHNQEVSSSEDNNTLTTQSSDHNSTRANASHKDINGFIMQKYNNQN